MTSRLSLVAATADVLSRCCCGAKGEANFASTTFKSLLLVTAAFGSLPAWLTSADELADTCVTNSWSRGNGLVVVGLLLLLLIVLLLLLLALTDSLAVVAADSACPADRKWSDGSGLSGPNEEEDDEATAWLLLLVVDEEEPAVDGDDVEVVEDEEEEEEVVDEREEEATTVGESGDEIATAAAAAAAW